MAFLCSFGLLPVAQVGLDLGCFAGLFDGERFVVESELVGCFLGFRLVLYVGADFADLFVVLEVGSIDGWVEITFEVVLEVGFVVDIRDGFHDLCHVLDPFLGQEFTGALWVWVFDFGNGIL